MPRPPVLSPSLSQPEPGSAVKGVRAGG